MSEQVFKSPGFFEREIEVQAKPPRRQPNSSPVGIIGAAEKGPAFIPTILNSLDDYTRIFGDIQKDKLAGHAVAEFFTAKSGGEGAIQYIRTLGLGFGEKETTGQSSKAGFKAIVDGGGFGGVQILCATHSLNVSEGKVYRNFGVSGTPASLGQFIKALFILHKDAQLITFNNILTVIKKPGATSKFKANRAVTISANPDDSNYLTKVLNTDPYQLDEYGYYLYADFPLQKLFAGDTTNFEILRSKDNTIELGNFEKRFEAPKTSKFISQPFGSKEYNLFSFESLDDGIYASEKYKISISNLRASTDVDYKFGTFNVEVRDINDTDDSPIIYESYVNCTLDPASSNYIGKLIGDQKVYFNYDASTEIEKRIISLGENINQSTRIRVIIEDDVKNGIIPQEALPFGFKGIPCLISSITSQTGPAKSYITPPVPYRFKITKGQFNTNSTYTGQKHQSETVDVTRYWGILNHNADSTEKPNSRSTTGVQTNKLIQNLSKFMGLGVSTLENDKISDDLNHNKFSLSKIAFPYETVADLPSSISDAYIEAVYLREKSPNALDYKITAFDDFNTDNPVANDIRISLSSVLSEDKAKFNKFSACHKFTVPFFGGWDGLNIFDKDSINMNDRSSSTEVSGAPSLVHGKASTAGFESGLAGTNAVILMQGSNFSNNIVNSYIWASNLMLEPASAYVHVVLLPGIRDRLICSHVATKVQEYGKAIYLMDLSHYNKDGIRLYDDKVDNGKKPDVTQTINALGNRNFDNNYVATYFPDVLFDDVSDKAAIGIKRTIKCPASIIAMSALAKSEGTRSIQPWFAPAGFSNGANDRIKGVSVRLRAEDRDDLYENRINPIATFPGNNYVIFGQKTLQISNSALSRVNVRRLMVEVKRGVERAAQSLLFEPHTAKTRSDFAATVNSFLTNIKINSGIENFRVSISDKAEEIDRNELSGTIIIVPTRVVEFISMDFIVTNSGVSFA